VTFAVDANCIIAAVSHWHADHHAAIAELERRLDRGESMSVPAHALTEAYSVLTRFPAPHRISCAEAWHLLKAGFSDQGSIVSLTARQDVALLSRLAESGVGGGRVYDARIAESAVRAGASVLLTFNPRHFEPAPTGLTVVVPA
jgi:predicted nucleic acid-binding protein